MTDDARGIAGDRRRNPFPSLNDTEYELFLLTIEKCVAAGVESAMDKYQKSSCLPHAVDIEHVKATVFGSAENGVAGLDDRVNGLERSMATLSRITWVAVSAFIVAFIGLLVGLIQFAVIGK
jgi:uncharacterized protein (UPF0303 family)